MSCDEASDLDRVSLQLTYLTDKYRALVLFFGSGVWHGLGSYFTDVRCGTGYNFPRWSPTLSGLMLVLSVPVLTRSPSRLQFLLAIATRLPFWPGPADLKHRVNIVWVGLNPSKYQRNVLKCTLTKWRGVCACRSFKKKNMSEYVYIFFRLFSLWRVGGLPPTLFL